jgi:hypothetical protein
MTPLLLLFVMFMGTVCIRNISATSEASKLPEPHERAAFMALLSSIQHAGNGIGALFSSAMLVTVDLYAGEAGFLCIHGGLAVILHR